MSRPRIPELWIARESSNQLNPDQHRSSPPTTSISKTPSSLAFPPCTTVPQGSMMGRPIRTRRHRPATDVCVYIWPEHSREMLRCQDIHMSTHNILAAGQDPRAAYGGLSHAKGFRIPRACRVGIPACDLRRLRWRGVYRVKFRRCERVYAALDRDATDKSTALAREPAWPVDRGSDNGSAASGPSTGRGNHLAPPRR